MESDCRQSGLILQMAGLISGFMIRGGGSKSYAMEIVSENIVNSSLPRADITIGYKKASSEIGLF